jgi:ribosomal protein L7Ae-like RNA K-turn-binding protein
LEQNFVHILHLIGIAKKAGKLEVGEEPVGSAARGKNARLLLVAKDAAPATVRRTAHFAEAGSCLMLSLPADKAALGSAVGRSSCAMVAVTDIGLADAIAKKLAVLDPSAYSAASAALEVKARRAMERRQEALRHEKNRQEGKLKKKPSAEETPPEEAAAPAPSPVAPAPSIKKIPKPAPYHAKRSSDTHRSFRSGKNKTAHRTAAPRFAGSRPVKHGKGSGNKNKQ